MDLLSPIIVDKSVTTQGGVVTVSAPVGNRTQTWNGPGQTFVGETGDYTDTASGPLSRIWQRLVNGVERIAFLKDGAIAATLGIYQNAAQSYNGSNVWGLAFYTNGVDVYAPNFTGNYAARFGYSATIALALGGGLNFGPGNPLSAADIGFSRISQGVLGIGNGTAGDISGRLRGATPVNVNDYATKGYVDALAGVSYTAGAGLTLTGSVFSVADAGVTNAKLANVATATFKGRTTAGTGSPEDLTGTQATALLDLVTTSAKGLAPASGGGTTNFLRADGTWAAPAGGGGSSGAVTLISEVVTSGSQTTVNFSSIPATYRNLMLCIHARGTASGSINFFYMQLNGDTGANYDTQYMNYSNTSGYNQDVAQTAIKLGYFSTASGVSNVADVAELTIFDYRGTTFQKVMSGRGTIKAGTTSGSLYGEQISGWWRNTSAITSLTVFPTAGGFVNGSIFSLYGLM